MSPFHYPPFHFETMSASDLYCSPSAEQQKHNKFSGLLESNYSQSPSGSVAYVLKESHDDNVSKTPNSSKMNSPYGSKQSQSLTKTDIEGRVEQSKARRDSLMEDIKNKNREHLEYVKEVRRGVFAKEQLEQQQKKKQLEEKMLVAQENKMKDLEAIRDKCMKEERKVELVKLRAAELRANSCNTRISFLVQ